MNEKQCLSETNASIGMIYYFGLFFFSVQNDQRIVGGKGEKQQVNQLKSTAWPPRLCSGAQLTRNAKPHTINRESSQMKVQEANLLKTGP